MRAVQAGHLFSVIIPMRNEEENIARCLTSLQHLQIAAEEFEVIVVDNGSGDHSVEVARQFQQSINLKILERPGIYISGARNAGAGVARGSYLAFLDADCEAKPDWLSQAASMISRGSPGIFGSFYLIPDGSSWVARNWYGDRERKESGEVSDLPGGDLFVSRELFCRLQGFDESIQTNEDFEFCQRARADGMSICSLPELSVIHWGTPQSVAGFFRRHRWHGMHVLRVFLRNLPALYNFKAVALAFYTVACVAAMLAGGIVAARSGRFELMIGATAALLAPPLLLGLRAAVASRRLRPVAPMTLLFLIYAVARAWSLLDWRNWMSRAAL